MTYKEKYKIYKSLQDADSLKKDEELLLKRNPKTRVFKKHKRKPEEMQREILWDLLDYASPEEIKAHRKGKKEQNKEDLYKQLQEEHELSENDIERLKELNYAIEDYVPGADIDTIIELLRRGEEKTDKEQDKENKKKATPRTKKKKNTPKSTGKTSATQKSKKR